MAHEVGPDPAVTWAGPQWLHLHDVNGRHVVVRTDSLQSFGGWDVARPRDVASVTTLRFQDGYYRDVRESVQEIAAMLTQPLRLGVGPSEDPPWVPATGEHAI